MDSNGLFLFHSELIKLEEILADYVRYKDLLFKLSPPEWQEVQRAKTMKAKFPSDKDAQVEHNRALQEAAGTNGKYSNLP